MADEPSEGENRPSDAAADNAELGAILSGFVAFDQALTNRLTDSHIDSAIKWAKRFRDLYDGIVKVNRDLHVHNVIADFGWDRADVNRAIEHLNSMRMNRD